MTTGTREAGEFCWINVLTPQPEEARAFFGKLLGWTYAEIPGLGHRMQVDGHDIGGLFDLEGPKTPEGMPPLVCVMLKVENAEITCEKVRSFGGKAKAPIDMHHLRRASCTDPSGAEFDLWEPKTAHGTAVHGNRRGAPSWFELVTTDLENAATFYSAVFGWTRADRPLTDANYATFKHGIALVAGIRPIMPNMGETRPQWGTYFTVTDADETAREAVKLGADIRAPVRDVPGIGRLCGVTSPQGVRFHVIQHIH
jgi:uncharacterized protein